MDGSANADKDEKSSEGSQLETQINYNNDNLKKISKDGVNFVKSGVNFKNNKVAIPKLNLNLDKKVIGYGVRQKIRDMEDVIQTEVLTARKEILVSFFV